MKRFIICAFAAVLLLVAAYYLHYYEGVYLNVGGEQRVTTSITVAGDGIFMKNPNNGEFRPFEIRGVNMGSGEPGSWSTDFAIAQADYERWFGMMQEMGANTLRIYTIQQDTFYKAFFAYNTRREEAGLEPLWLLHGVWVDDVVQNSSKDAYDDAFLKDFQKNCRRMVNVIHGQGGILPGTNKDMGSGRYRMDISRWVIGYILGVEWEDVTVEYTNQKYAGKSGYTEYIGEYMYTTEEASPFECMLARVGDSTIAYESERYHQQRLVAFSNWPTTDPFTYSVEVAYHFQKCAKVDVEHIRCSDRFLSGQFASYHVYPYYPNYLRYEEDWTQFGLTGQGGYHTGKGEVNTYRAYLDMLTGHHTMPVVISEFGVSTGRGMAQRDVNTGRNQGHMSEDEQGEALVMCWEDIMSAGCAGGCVFTWQDEWFKRTWNTMYAVDLTRTPYWSDYQTNEQYFGLLSFDPGEEQSVCYIDGDVSEWTQEDLVVEENGFCLSVKYDERYIYFLIHKDGLDFERDTIYLPIDTTEKSGSTYAAGRNVSFDRPADFLVTIRGPNQSRVQVQERYEALRCNYAREVYRYDTYIMGNIPARDSPRFVNINMILQTAVELETSNSETPAEVYETGILRYGNGNPNSPDYDSLADFICQGDYIELRLPWQILNFCDPSRMMIHDDYYDGNYGVEYIRLPGFYAGVGGPRQQTGDDAQAAEPIHMEEVPMKGWGNTVTYHERLKTSYTAMRSVWGGRPTP